MTGVVIMAMAGGTLTPDIVGDNEVWGASRAYLHYAGKTDRVYSMSGFASWDKRNKEFISEVNELGVPVIFPKATKIIPKSEDYPLLDVLRYFGFVGPDEEYVPSPNDQRGYFTNTISYMAAQAIMERKNPITIHEIHTSTATKEYFEQKACLDFWIGVAHGKGIQLRISEGSNVGKPHPWESKMYGYFGNKNWYACTTLLRLAAQQIEKIPVEWVPTDDIIREDTSELTQGEMDALALKVANTAAVKPESLAEGNAGRS